MTLKISSGKKKKPRRVLVFGRPKTGKSTWASRDPKSLVLPLEDGINDIDCQSTEIPESYSHYIAMVTEIIKMVASKELDVKFLAIDGLDRLIKMLEDFLLEQENMSLLHTKLCSIEEYLCTHIPL